MLLNVPFTKGAIALLQIQFLGYFISFVKTPILGWVPLQVGSSL
ncbi:hypothetical protein NIES4073_26070 [Kalymmatonema gypsitolerans NIES-4073]|nr:hypothetical protein NIES4073_26070 [Scytonema sp. NIES-4073]